MFTRRVLCKPYAAGILFPVRFPSASRASPARSHSVVHWPKDGSPRCLTNIPIIRQMLALSDLSSLVLLQTCRISCAAATSRPGFHCATGYCSRCSAPSRLQFLARVQGSLPTVRLFVRNKWLACASSKRAQALVTVSPTRCVSRKTLRANLWNTGSTPAAIEHHRIAGRSLKAFIGLFLSDHPFRWGGEYRRQTHWLSAL